MTGPARPSGSVDPDAGDPAGGRPWREVRPGRFLEADVEAEADPAADQGADARDGTGDDDTDPGARPAADGGARRPNSAGPGPDALDELRGLLVGPERQRLEVLERKGPAPSAEQIAAVLPDAVRRRVALDDDLSGALASTIEGGLKASVQRDPQGIADAIHPALGPAIRRSIQSALSQALEGFNVALENSLSPKSLLWRVEAMRTGKPFAEVVMLKSLVYRVEQVFLLHRDSGVLLAEAASPEALRRDPEVVSSMLGAIRDFVLDSFGAGPEDDLDRIDLAGLRISLVGAPHAVIAAVVRGTPPESLRSELVEALEEITLRTAPELERFGGDCAPFEVEAHRLEACLRGEIRPRRRSPLVKLVAPAIGLALLAWLGLFLWRGYEDRVGAARVVDALRAAPGYVVLSVEEEGDQRVVRGLRDPDAAAPAALAAAALDGFDAARWRFELTPWNAPGEDFLRGRLERVLDLPTGVSLELDGEAVRLRGSADRAWIDRARAVLPGVAGGLEADLSGLADHDLEALTALAAAVDGNAVRFAVGHAAVDPADPLTRGVRATVEDLGRRALAAGRLARITLAPVRHAAEEGGAALALRRMSAVRDFLAPVAGPNVLFEPRLVVDGEVPVGESGAVRLPTEVLGAAAPTPGER